MSLSDFTTLELAQAHSLVVGRMVSPDMVISMLTEHDSALTLEELAKTNAKAAGFWLALNGGAVTEYNVLTGSPIGMKHQALLTYLVSVNAVTQAFKNAVVAYGNKITYPYADATEADFDEANDTGETIVLPQNNSQHVLIVATSVQPRKPTDLIVQHRFGADSLSLTEWHDCGTVRNVYYTQLTYKTMIPASPTAYRELRLVSPLSLGVSVL
jgi:hypothetical protein